MPKLKITHPTEYPVEIGYTLEIPASAGPRALIYDQAVEPFALAWAKRLGIEAVKGIGGGEEAKTLERFGALLSWMAQQALPRDTILYVAGGGTLTDLGGYLAASYLRGIEYISIPTTTLAIVDASVGGKTGINLPEGKNLVGAFYPPKGVYADLEALQTLPRQAFKEGLVEAFKHGIIDGDAGLLELESLSPNHPDLENYLARAVAVKIRIVEADPSEKGERRKLNLGHTLAHALEAATLHQLSHGAAVAYGLLYAALLGRAHGGADLLPQVQKLLTWLSPAALPRLSWDELTPYLARDKKKIGSALNWVVPMDMGKLALHPVDEAVLRQCYEEFLTRV